MTKMTFVLDGSITNTAPIKKSIYGGGKNQDGALLAPMMAFKNDKHYQGPATGDRGGLRRCSAKIALRRRYGDNFALENIDDIYYLFVGGVKGTGAAKAQSFAAQERYRAANPVIELWGAGSPFLAGSVFVGHMRSKMPVDHRSREFQPVIRRDPLLDGDVPVSDAINDKHAARTAIINLRAPYQAAKAEIKGAKGRSKAEKVASTLATLCRKVGDDSITTEQMLDDRLAQFDKELMAINAPTVSAQTALPGSEVIPAGIEFEQRITLWHTRELAIGLFVDALQESANRPYWGGGKAAGCGALFERIYTVRVFDEETQAYVPDCTVVIKPFERITITPADGVAVPKLQACYDRWLTADLIAENIDLMAPVGATAATEDEDDEVTDA